MKEILRKHYVHRNEAGLIQSTVKDQLLRIDATYPDVDFFYSGSDSEKRRIQTVEEQEFPQFYHRKPAQAPGQQDALETDVVDVEPGDTPSGPTSAPKKPKPEEGHHVFAENRKGVSYDNLFGPYIDDANRIVVTDPYVRYF